MINSCAIFKISWTTVNQSLTEMTIAGLEKLVKYSWRIMVCRLVITKSSIWAFIQPLLTLTQLFSVENHKFELVWLHSESKNKNVFHYQCLQGPSEHRGPHDHGPLCIAQPIATPFIIKEYLMWVCDSKFMELWVIIYILSVSSI